MLAKFRENLMAISIGNKPMALRTLNLLAMGQKCIEVVTRITKANLVQGVKESYFLLKMIK